jgi:hypothetical protein
VVRMKSGADMKNLRSGRSLEHEVL